MSLLSLPRRLLHFTGLAIFSLIIYACVVFASSATTLDQLSVTTAYICVLLMATALLIGPSRVLRSGAPNPVNIYMRRDIGIWAALSGLAHLILGTVQSMNAAYISQYVEINNAVPSESARLELFLWGSVTAFVVGILLLLLLSLSSDAALRVLGTRWWKRLQRFAYLAFVLTVFHGLMFQVLEGRSISLIVLLAMIFIAVLLVQVAGFMAGRRQH